MENNFNKMETSIDLQKYFDRIGFNGQAQPNLETLKQLNYLHTTIIPFENIDPLLKVPVKIDPESIQQKLVNELRGGYCFEQNLLFYHALNQIGFKVTPLAGRVLWNMPEDTMTQRTHVLILINIGDKKYLTDVGFGGQSLTGPLEFELEKPQETPHELYRITSKGDYFFMQVNLKNEWKTIYRFTLQPQHMVDYEVANWYTSTYPKHIFTNILSVARADKNCRFTLFNNKFNTHYLGSKTEAKTLETVSEIKEVLTNVFKIKLPQIESLNEVLTTLINSNQK